MKKGEIVNEMGKIERHIAQNRDFDMRVAIKKAVIRSFSEERGGVLRRTWPKECC